jgi:hypothetical protein
MKQLLRSLIVFMLLADRAVVPPPAPMQTAAPVRTAAPAGFPANLRWDLVPKWINWTSPNATISWPPNDGCTAAPEARTLPVGDLIDRFGSEGGSPRLNVAPERTRPAGRCHGVLIG